MRRALTAPPGGRRGRRAGGAAPDPRRPVWSRAARLPSFVASGGTIGIVEQLYRVAGVRVDTGGGETGTELHETTGIARPRPGAPPRAAARAWPQAPRATSRARAA